MSAGACGPMRASGAPSVSDDAWKAPLELFDLHCHLDFLSDAPAVAAAARAAGAGMLSATVTPEGYERASAALAAFGNVRVGLGLHPWWVADGRCGAEDIARFERLAPDAPFIGEVGLDFGKRCAPAREAQRAAFERVATACADAAPRLLSLHAVNAVDEVLDVLVRHGLTRRCACVFHWFSSSSEQLQRAIGAGCWFSVGARMLATRRGRSYARAIPEDRLLLETDLPSAPDAAEGWPEIKAALREALAELERIRGRSLASRLAAASAQLLGMGEDISEPGPPLCG